MTFHFKLLSATMLIALTALSGMAFAQATPTPAAAPVPIKSPTDWIRYEDMTFTPVADTSSRHLAAARPALDAQDTTNAAAQMRTVGDGPGAPAARAGQGGQDHRRARGHGAPGTTAGYIHPSPQTLAAEYAAARAVSTR